MTSAAPTTELPRAERMARTADCLDEARHARPARRDNLVEQVVLLNMPVARSVAQRYRDRGLHEDDLDQVAYLALTRAAQNYDTELSSDFLSYAVPCIRGELKKHFRDSGWSVRPPRRVQELQARISSARSDMAQQLGRSPDRDELADELHVDGVDLDEAMSADGCFQPTSLDRPLVEDSTTTVGERLTDESHDLASAEARMTLAPLVRRLGERDRRIVELRFFHQATQQEIAEDIGVTQMHVSRLITRILGNLREDLDDADDAATEDPGA
ncbi:sigma-70 family RNA polymerase sigma factor [Nocardioides iriomotensis]|uniref:Sigma-70 family RNA polymerase sigma factor n=2 Tax=Nocardioides iriomotensis TaxID=715784 RepID=A0A4Q5IX99_9ACTN|nr:sigma-70 family RNA polymerase sigma factor [Nocardioides iriomotensis]